MADPQATMELPRERRVVLLDGHAIIFRAYFAMRDPLRHKETGENTTAPYGFVNTLRSVLDDLKPTHMALALDVSDDTTFRKAMYEPYKAHREKPPDDFPQSVARCRQIAEAFSIPIYEAEGYEADDVLATLADQAAETGIETWIATLDSDLVQLVREGVGVYMFRPFKRDVVRYDSDERVRDRYGIDPIQMIDYKALVGDTSDNIPGVKGIGDKTAVKLLNQWATVEEVYEHLDEVGPKRAQSNLIAGQESAELSKKLATIVHDAPVRFDLEAADISEYDHEEVVEAFRDLNFRSHLEWFGEWSGTGVEAAPAARQVEAEYEIVRDETTLAKWVAKAAGAPLLAVDLETSSTDTIDSLIAGYALAVAEGEACYIPVRHADDGEPTVYPETAIEALRPVLEDGSVPKVLHNAKFDMKVLRRHGVELRGLTADTMLQAYLLNAPHIGLKALALSRLGVEMTPIEDLIGKGKSQVSMLEVKPEEAGLHAAADADMTLRLAAELGPELAKNEQLEALQRDVELPLVPLLAEMELTGVALNTGALEDLDARLDAEIAAKTREVHEAAGHEFNIGSPKQLSTVLFDEMKLPKTRKTSQGYSTDAQQLERLAETHPIVERILQWRELTKLRSTYVEALPPMVHASTGRIHTDYNQTVAETGRLSSENPNLQNIPVRTGTGSEVRAAFVPRAWEGIEEEVVFLSADYSQIELRVLAHLSGDEGLIEAFRNGEDIHAATAAGAYGVETADVQPEMRRIAKMMNFGVIYGLSAHGLSQRSGMERADAQAFIDAYFGRFARVKDWIEEIKESTKRDKYAETLLGRRRKLPNIESRSFQERSHAERQAVNMPVQGTAADVMKLAMLRIAEQLRARELQSRMLMQVHDELIFETLESELGDVAAVLTEVMPTAIEMVVPLQIEMKSGPNWRDLEPLQA